MLDLAGLFLEYRADIQRLALVAISGAALRWGAGPERSTGLALLYLLLADIFYHLVFGPGVALGHIDIGHALIDLSALALMGAIALFANRMYTLWIGALQMIAVLAHVARDLETGIAPLVYAIMFIAPSYVQIALLAGGTWAHRKRRNRFGKYSSWRTSSIPSWVSGRLAWLNA